MFLHSLHQTQLLPLSMEEAWAFLSDPGNLDEITPPEVCFRIVQGADQKMFDGQIIEYRIRLAPLVWTTWVTELKCVVEGESFIDEQRFGPYKFWHHYHGLRPVEGGVEMIDRIHYSVGFWLAGEVAHKLFVRRQLQRIFDFRRAKLNELFPVEAALEEKKMAVT